MIHFYLFLALGIVLAATHGEEVVSLKKKKERNVGGSNFSSWLEFFLIPTVVLKKY